MLPSAPQPLVSEFWAVDGLPLPNPGRSGLRLNLYSIDVERARQVAGETRAPQPQIGQTASSAA
jgi:hypothetical protein